MQTTYFGLEVTVHDTMMTHERERLQHLACEPADKTGCEAMEVVRLDQLIQVDAEQLHRDT